MGGYYFWGGNLENLRNGPFLGGRLGINFLENVSFEASLGYVPTSTVHGSRQAHYLLPHFDVVIHMTPWRVVPYFAVGAGFRYMQIDEAYRQGVAPEGGGVLWLCRPSVSPLPKPLTPLERYLLKQSLGGNGTQ